MTKIGSKDLFSQQSSDYALYRPMYPDALFEYLAGLPARKKLAWDCGTGNGQAAVKLAAHFERVVATDISDAQLKNAAQNPKVEYRKASAESSKLTGGTVDLIAAAQAFHWFRRDEFYDEVRKVAAPGAVVALWCYGLAVISPEIDAVVLKLYRDVLSGYWEPERRLVEDGYANIPFPFQRCKTPSFEMKAQWTPTKLVGYLGTWSAVQAYIKKHKTNPIEVVARELAAAWGRDSAREVRWPLSLLVGNVEMI